MNLKLCYRYRFFRNLKHIYYGIENYYPDVILHCVEDNVEIKAHRIILASSSDYFEKVFSWSDENVVHVHNGINSKTLNIILKFMYTGRVKLTLDTVTDVLSAAHYFTLPEIVDHCCRFISDNLEISVSLDLLRFSWNFDDWNLKDELVSFIGENFSFIANDIDLKEKLYSLPLDMMVAILKSDDLVLRDEETDLPTRPADREKLLLEFILSYTDRLVERTNALTLLLPCVKWPLLKIYGEENFIFNKIVPRLDNMIRKSEIEKFLDITHSEWFLSPDNTDPTEQDKSLYSTRAFSCSELVPLFPMGKGGQGIWTSSSGNYGKIMAYEKEHITKIDVVSRLWDGKTVIGGIGMYFSSGRHQHAGLKSEDGINVNTLELRKKEHIVEVSGKSDKLINNIIFETSLNNTYGPYGGDSGGNTDYLDTITSYRRYGEYWQEEDGYLKKMFLSVAPGPHNRVYLDSILVGIAWLEVITEDSIALCKLRFLFREMLPSSHFLICSNKHCEVHLITERNEKWDDTSDCEAEHNVPLSTESDSDYEMN